MICLWDGYTSSPRLATVNCGEGSFDTETLCIQPGHINFSSDGYGKDILEENSKLYGLQTGDIISIDGRGIIERLFCAKEDDAVVFITGHCNSNCVMCPSSDQERRLEDGLSDFELQQYIDMLPKSLGHIGVTGGEPTLRTETFFHVMGALADKFPSAEVQLLTNGQAFASKKITDRLLAHCPAYLQTAIPIHGSSEALHDSVTRASGSFAETVLGISRLVAAGIYVELRVVVTRMNVLDLMNIAEFIVKQFPNAGVVNFIGLETRGNCAKNFDLVYCSQEESIKYILPAAKTIANAGIDVGLYNYPLCVVDRSAWGICKQSISPEKIRYAPECSGCEAMSYCGGFFNTTLSMTKPDVHPIKFGR